MRTSLADWAGNATQDLAARDMEQISCHGGGCGQEVLTRPENLPQGLTPDDALAFVRYLASQSHLQEVHFLWRPLLADADDDMVLELAFAAGCQYIITHNVADFRSSEQLGVTALSPRDFLSLIRKTP